VVARCEYRVGVRGREGASWHVWFLHISGVLRRTRGAGACGSRGAEAIHEHRIGRRQDAKVKDRRTGATSLSSLMTGTLPPYSTVIRFNIACNIPPCLAPIANRFASALNANLSISISEIKTLADD